MLNRLRTGNPYIAFYLLFYGLIIKSFYFFHPLAPSVNPASDGLFYSWFIHKLQEDLNVSALGFSTIAFCLVSITAILLNALVNNFKLLGEFSFFPAFAFLLFSTLFKEWNTVSAPLLSAIPMLFILRQVFFLYKAENGRVASFNLGLLTGLSGFIYQPSLLFILFIWFSLAVLRPFKFHEWILSVLGFLCPVYLWAVFLFLTDNLPQISRLLNVDLTYPDERQPMGTILAVSVLLIYFIYGSIKLQASPARTVQIRKYWFILWFMLIISLFLPFLGGEFRLEGLLFAFIPMSVIISEVFWNTKKKQLLFLLHLLPLLILVLQQWVI